MNKLLNSSKSFIIYILKEIISFLLFLPGLMLLKFFLKKKERLLVLNYHNFSKYNNYKIKRGNILETGYARNFEKQIKFLKKYFNFCYPEEFFDGKPKKGINILITFDDGYKDNYDIALPILKKHNTKCVFFIATDFINTKNWLWHDKVRYLINKGKIEESSSERVLKQMNNGKKISISFENKINTLFKKEALRRLMMNWEEVKEIYNSGFKIGAHTASHTILSFLNRENQKNEIKDPILTLEKQLKIKSDIFAYPNGLYNKDSLKILTDNKVEYAFTTIPGSNSLKQNKLEIKRIGINASDSIYILFLKMIVNIVK